MKITAVLKEKASIPCAHRLKTSSLTVEPHKSVLIFFRSSSSPAMALSAIIFRMCAIIREIKTRRVHESYLELIIIFFGTISFTLNPELSVAYRNHPITYFAQQKPANLYNLLQFLYTIICNLALMNAGATLGYSSVFSRSPNYWLPLMPYHNELWKTMYHDRIAMGMFAVSVGIYLAEISITSWKTVITVTSQIAHWNSDQRLEVNSSIFFHIVCPMQYFLHPRKINITIDPFLIIIIVGIIQLIDIVIIACYSKSKLQLLLLYCIVVQSYAIHKNGLTSTTLETTSADTGIIDQNSNESFQSDQVKKVFFPLGTKDNPLEGLSKLPIEWENTRRDHSFKKITVDDNDSSKETSDKTSQFPLLPKDDSLTGERELCRTRRKISFYC
ncbi:hypothetical protein ALC53_00707 [Atta colombica]|uniref:Uncharacterized protein n=1 Tax=Atta colombica TaxID=520822 RepID=A0A195BWV7_9HYME|nr:hypothetical protein ALC53_00707 [Atta colombica]